MGSIVLRKEQDAARSFEGHDIQACPCMVCRQLRDEWYLEYQKTQAFISKTCHHEPYEFRPGWWLCVKCNHTIPLQKRL